MKADAKVVKGWVVLLPSGKPDFLFPSKKSARAFALNEIAARDIARHVVPATLTYEVPNAG